MKISFKQKKIQLNTRIKLNHNIKIIYYVLIIILPSCQISMFPPMIRSVKTKQVHKTEFCRYLKTVQKKKERHIQPRSQGLSSLPPLSLRQWRQRRETLGTRLRHIIDKLSFNIFIQSNKNLLLGFLCFAAVFHFVFLTSTKFSVIKSWFSSLEINYYI